MSLKKLTIEQKKGIAGLMFVAPWFIGFVLFFAVPLLESLRYSFSVLEVSNDGFKLSWQGFKNYHNAFFVHATFNRLLAEAVTDMLVNVPLILFFSLFSATLLNQKFRGRFLARTIFFLPVILASGVIANIDYNSFTMQLMSSLTKGGTESGGLTGLKSFELSRLLLQSGISETIVGYLTGAVDRIYEIISAAGIQTLIFLAGLQSISPSLYEASKIEGATAYEAFWKITFPMVSPLILTNVIYTVIDSFTNNKTTQIITDTAFKAMNFGLSSAMSWIYFTIISVILVLVATLVSRKVFYNN
ncbi:ABC transporter permease [Paenibacillus sp. MY03]|uniref:carbohydrate ABC transporter permease n=1 Tax=Paenibacillus sp. MY03 TaxID=302980 RepID=UPI000B3C335B|nr:sugar ABC transporter permease [Paenibacillus sp. MY03]OUS78111.1 ABC transporter permease [Paenibacillus sp. MY03]